MCNLYRLQTAQAEIRHLFGVKHDRYGNLAADLAVAPDRPAPIITRNADGEREMRAMRWGFPPPPQGSAALVTNVRNVASAFWRPWLKPEQRCVVPATAFSEWEDTKPKKTVRWFAIDAEQPPFVFAGIWRPWTGTRGTKKDPIEGEHLIFSFLTCEANDVVRPIHSKAMPAILTTPEEIETWLTAPADEALKLQRPLPNESLALLPV